MLPSFRLIAATFLCGFFVVFAGLRLAASLNDIHEGLPVLAAHAAPVSITPVADREARRGLAAVPVMYDLRFAIGTVAPTLVRLPPTVLDQPSPPLSIVPPEDVDRESSLNAAPDAEPGKEAIKQAEPETTVAAIPPAAPVIPESAVVPDAPALPEAPAVAAIDARASPDTAADRPAAETPTPVTQATANEPPSMPAPAIEESLPNLESGAAPAETPAAPEPDPRSPAAALPAPKPQAAKSSPRARLKVARKKPIRVARRATPANSFGSFTGAFATLPGTAQR
jgi:hypothetical protein